MGGDGRVRCWGPGMPPLASRRGVRARSLAGRQPSCASSPTDTAPVLIHRPDVPAGSIQRRDGCIVGAGAAGLALAWAFDASPFEVLLLEAGGLQVDPRDQDGADGTAETAILPGRSDYPFHETRLRALGGTTRLWTGVCLDLGPADFDERPWLPGSGWPFGPEVLEPLYRQAASFLVLPAWGSGAWQRHSALDGDGLVGRSRRWCGRSPTCPERPGPGVPMPVRNCFPAAVLDGSG